MRPLTLHLQFFGPYRDENIDFQKFDATPLFLISGKTGSGKTTIFDGMCYALFDQSSGVDREPQDMRSDFATTGDHTRVTFTFSHRNRTYRIVREPAQILKKKRGTGVKRTAASVELTVFERETEIKQLTKARQVNEYLQELLQMDGKQFAQIVLLPQGEFRRFLVAPSEDKAAVLEQLFNTEIFARWTDQLRDKRRRDRAQTEKVAQQLEQLQTRLIWTQANQDRATELLDAHQTPALLTLVEEQQQATQSAVAALTEQVTAAQDQVTMLTKQDTREEQLLQDRQQLVIQTDRQQKLAAQAPAMKTVQQQIAELEWSQGIQSQWQERQTARHNLTQRRTALQQAQAGLDQAQAAHVTATTAQTDAQSISDRIATTKDELAQQAKIKPIYQQIAALTTQLSQGKKDASAAQQTVVALQQKLTQTKQELQDQQQVVTGQATLYQTGQQLTKQDGQLKDWNRQLTALQTAEQQQQQETKQLTALQTQIATQRQATGQARQQAEDLNQELLNHEIVRLVGQLKPGSPCPICGATDHPSPAAVADTTVTEAEVKQAQAVAQQQQDRLTQLTTRQQNLREELTTRQTQQQADVRVFWQSLPATVAVDPMTLPAVAQRLADLTNQQQAALRTLHQQQAAITQAQAQVDQLKKQVTQCEQQLQTAQTTQQEKTRAVDRLTAQLTTQRQQLPATAATLADFKRQEQQLQQQLATDQAAWEAVTQRVKQATDRLTVATTEVKAATAELEKSQQRCQMAADQVQALLSQHFEAVTPETESQVAACLEQLTTLPQKRQRVQDFRTQQERVTTTIAELKKRVADQPEPDRAQTQAALQAAAKQVNALQDQRHNQQDQFQRNAETVSALKRQMAQQETALKRSQELTELVDVVNGDGPNSKLGLERYVLQTYLRQILTVGNQRLQQLTNGRYQFLVDDQPATYKKNSGLEINVYDDHVGEQRSVHTLSGGESFIAALALALALGEVIQQTTGSVDVDALFIDEGFGSLDEDALMTALESLETVEGQHRMIGIISHVSELRAQVPNQLQVVSNGNGESKITYQIDEG
ncbi:SMC family ATPase [Levilactobacillus brevis]|uniref:Nuclease SbcCD subunit C n=1 Tax=Levilactobacillus hammesii TaxID=267633 RepID=A0A921JXC8_9LACO|nr:SMC family ATPase [Levilactobacillus brevis]HJE86697.1 SMC family ATPase [Levilactobacillus hammesii]